MGIIFLLAFALFAVAQGRAQELPEGSKEWELFKIDYSKVYATKSEEIRRMKIFQTNLELITEHNERYEKGLESFITGINERTDHSPEELSAQRGCFLPSQLNETKGGKVMTYKAGTRLPKSVDWREKRGVTPVKDQSVPRGCNSCWAFSAVGSLEGQHSRKYKKLVTLSVQNIIDCIPGHDGCRGGTAPVAFEFIKSNGGIDTEESYPYEAIARQCRFKRSDVGAKIKDYVRVPYGNEAALQKAVALYGPVSVAIDVRSTLFENYRGGVYENPECSSEGKHLGHAVVVVGYGTTQDGKDYWLVKNSWGARWGVGGYIKMARNQNNMCGITSYAFYPVV